MRFPTLLAAPLAVAPVHGLRNIQIFFLFLGLVSPIPLLAQAAPTTPLPNDPVALMSLAHEKNGLNSPDVQPWHIRGSYTFFDKDGKSEDTGVYEEWWVSPKKYKRSYTSTKFKQVEYATGSGLYREGSQDWPGANEMLIRSNLIEPLPGDDVLKEFTPEEQPESIGNVKLNCVVLEYPLRPNLKVPKDFFPISCFDPTMPVLRINSPKTSLRTGYNQIVVFQGHYLARDFRTTSGGKPRIEFKLDVAEALKDSPEAVLAPPATALPVDMRIVSLKGWPIALKRVVPEYPVSARNAQIQGTVGIQVLIGKDGHVASLRVKSGPVALRQAAVDATQQGLYIPFRVLGEPVEVDTEISVDFDPG
jgi:hypothetical protein